MNNDSPSSLSESALCEAIAHLKAKWTSSACGACGHDRHEVNGLTSLVLHSSPGVTDVAAPALPCITVMCGNCGLTRLVNATLAITPETRKAMGWAE